MERDKEKGPKAEVVRTFKYDAEYYRTGIGGFHSASFHGITQAFQRIANTVRFDRALDFGCGDAFYGPFLGSEVAILDGVDKSDVLNQSSNRVYYNQLYRHDLGKPWLVPEANYDLLWSVEVIEHVENYREFLRNAHGVLRPGGYLFLTTTTYFWTLFVLLVIFRRQISVSALWEFTRGFLGSEKCRSRFVMRFWDYFTGHYHGFPTGQLRNEVLRTGFQVLDVQYLHVQPVFPVQYFDQPYRGRHARLVRAGVMVLRLLGLALNFLCRRLDLYAPNALIIARKQG